MDTFLQQIMAADAANMVATLGEPITYLPLNNIANGRVVQVVIDRVPIGQQGTTGPRDRPSLSMTCCTDPASGIDPATVNFDQDVVMVAYPATATPKAFHFTQQITQQSPGMWTVVLR